MTQKKKLPEILKLEQQLEQMSTTYTSSVGRLSNQVDELAKKFEEKIRR